MKVWRLIIFETPPAWARMRPAKSGKCWFRIFKRRDDVLPVSRRLKLDGIKYLCDKVEGQTFVPRHADKSGFGGRLNATPTKGSWRVKKRRRN